MRYCMCDMATTILTYFFPMFYSSSENQYVLLPYQGIEEMGQIYNQ